MDYVKKGFLIIMVVSLACAYSAFAWEGLKGPTCQTVSAASGCPLNFNEVMTMTGTYNAHPGDISADAAVPEYADSAKFKYRLCCGGLGYDGYDFGLSAGSNTYTESFLNYSYFSSPISSEASIYGIANGKTLKISSGKQSLDIDHKIVETQNCDPVTHNCMLKMTGTSNAHIASCDDPAASGYDVKACLSACLSADTVEAVCKGCYKGTWSEDHTRFHDMFDGVPPENNPLYGPGWNCCGNDQGEFWIETDDSSAACCDSPTDFVYFDTASNEYRCSDSSAEKHIHGYVFESKNGEKKLSEGANVNARWRDDLDPVNNMVTRADGYYSVTVPYYGPGSTYNLVASKPGFESDSETGIDPSTNPEVNLTIIDSNSCRDDCTIYKDNDFICSPECYNRDDGFGCTYDESFANGDGKDIKDLCSGKVKGWDVEYNSTHKVICCNGIPSGTPVPKDAFLIRAIITTQKSNVESISVPMPIKGKGAATLNIVIT